MGYDQFLNVCTVKVKPERLNELIKKIEELIKNNRCEKIGGFFIMNDSVVYDSGWRNWYDTDIIALFLSKYVESGDLIFEGEDGVKTGYRFDGKGNVFRLIFPPPLALMIGEKL